MQKVCHNDFMGFWAEGKACYGFRLRDCKSYFLQSLNPGNGRFQVNRQVLPGFILKNDSRGFFGKSRPHRGGWTAAGAQDINVLCPETAASALAKNHFLK